MKKILFTLFLFSGLAYADVIISNGGTGSVVISPGGTGTVLIANTLPATIDPTLVAWWKFDEGLGTSAADSTGNGYTATWVDTATWVAGRVGPYAVSLTTPTNYLSTSLTPAGSSITIAVWVHPTDLSSEYHICEYQPIQTYISGSIVEFVSASTGTAATYIGSAGEWHHLVFTGDTTNLFIYEDGSKLTSLAAKPLASASGVVNIGRYALGSYHFNGYLDEIRIYNRALSSAEVTALYNSY